MNIEIPYISQSEYTPIHLTPTLLKKIKPHHFTKQSIMALDIAKYKAQDAKHMFIDSLHILIGITYLDETLAKPILEDLKLGLDRLICFFEKRMPRGIEKTIPSDFSISGKHVLDLTLSIYQKSLLTYQRNRISANLDHSPISTLHLLYGILHEKQFGSIAYHIIKDDLSIDPKKAIRLIEETSKFLCESNSS